MKNIKSLNILFLQTMLIFFAITANVYSQKEKAIRIEESKYNQQLIDHESRGQSSNSEQSKSSNSGSQYDVGVPSSSPFQLSGDISSTIQNSINQVTGKVGFGVPLTDISAGNTSYNVNLGYNGKVAFKMAQEVNYFSPTSTVGVGWNLSNPKIVVDNKQTGTRDDDTFFLLDGNTNSKLFCIKRGTNSNGSVWEFQLEKYSPWIIKYYYHNTIYDYWEITNENGVTYTYGSNTSTNPNNYINTLANGNWIGDSKFNSSASRQTASWNLSKIEDQWSNSISFQYIKQENHGQTEASYISKIISSKGANVRFTYNEKSNNEFFEPHTEISEPDAYQEVYEKKFLRKVDIYNNNNILQNTYELNYTVENPNNPKYSKRYLTNLVQKSYKNGQSHVLPAQEFEYHTSGDFNGGLKKIVYPSGGVVTYNYSNKNIFYNGQNRFKTFPNWETNAYSLFKVIAKDNYTLAVLITKNADSNGNHGFRFYRYSWNGEKWEEDLYYFPHWLPSNLHNLKTVFGKDFYGFAYDKGSHAYVSLFHINKDGKTWNKAEYNSIYIGSGDASFISGDDFVALGAKDGSRLDLFNWNGLSWSSKLIHQGGGEYFYGARNNFVISINENGGGDMITGSNHQDNYYMHYLDAEKKWQTKSWSAAADPYVNDIYINNNNPGSANIYPSNNIVGLVIKNNPELFFRWDRHYNLISVDNVIGAYDDSNPLQPVGNSGLFSLYNHFNKKPYKSPRFNGVNWNVHAKPSGHFDYYAKLNFGVDMMTYRQSNNYIGLSYYNPNENNWSDMALNNSGLIANAISSGINREFIIAGNKLYKKPTNITGPLVSTIGSLQYSNGFTATDGISHAFISEHNGGQFNNGRYFFMNKKTGNLDDINTGAKNNLGIGTPRLGGYKPFMSTKTIWLRQFQQNSSSFNVHLYRVIDDKFNNYIKDIVVNSVELDDKENTRKIYYTYNNPLQTPDNNATFYGEVILENKGFGSNSIGKIKTKYHNGNNDLQLLGVLLEEEIFDKNNILKQKNSTTWEKHLTYTNSGYSYSNRVISKTNEMYFGTDKITTTATNDYNSKGQLTKISTANSKGENQIKTITYAHEEYNFLGDKNFLTPPYETKSFDGNTLYEIEKSKWINDNGKVYIKQSLSGTLNDNLRLNIETSKISSNGSTLETHNGKGLYTSVVYGYSNLYEVATIVNAKHQDIINELDITYNQLQNLDTPELKIELLKLYERLPDAMISLIFYDNNGRVVNRVNERKEESYIYYDPYGRLDYITDGYGKVIEKKEYNFGD